MYVVLAVVLALIFASPANAQRPLLVFVLAGQSNMAGNDQVVPAETPDPGVYDVTFGQLRPAVDPLGDAGGFGPGRSIGRELERLNPWARIGLVMCAQGSTQMDRWVPGGDLYQRCIDRVRGVQKLGTVAGMFFGQGENDAERADWAGAWAVKFKTMVGQFRADVGAPTLPVVFSQLGRFPTATWGQSEFWDWSAVKAQQETVDLRHGQMIVTDDLFSDVHYDWDGYQQLGLRFADAWQAVVRRDR